MMGGALGLAILASLAASRTDTLLAAGDGQAVALTGGYHLAFLAGAAFALAAAILGGLLLRHGAYTGERSEDDDCEDQPAPCQGLAAQPPIGARQLAHAGEVQ
jgi:hypothetical protein